MSYKETLDMPIRSFWSFAKNIDRIRAAEDMRALDVASAAQNSEAYEKVRNKLEEELGVTFIEPPKPINHTAGVNKLISLASRMR